MRIVSWNIGLSGIRGLMNDMPFHFVEWKHASSPRRVPDDLKQEFPSVKIKSLKDLLDYFEADIVVLNLGPLPPE